MELQKTFKKFSFSASDKEHIIRILDMFLEYSDAKYMLVMPKQTQHVFEQWKVKNFKKNIKGETGFCGTTSCETFSTANFSDQKTLNDVTSFLSTEGFNDLYFVAKRQNILSKPNKLNLT